MLQTTLLASLGLACVGAVTVLPFGDLDASASTTHTEKEDKNPFPHRSEYPECVHISTEEFAALDNPIIVDARNKAEFAVIHIAGAENLIVGKMKIADLEALRGKDEDQPIVFYCNGHT